MSPEKISNPLGVIFSYLNVSFEAERKGGLQFLNRHRPAVACTGFYIKAGIECKNLFLYRQKPEIIIIFHYYTSLKDKFVFYCYTYIFYINYIISPTLLDFFTPKTHAISKLIEEA